MKRVLISAAVLALAVTGVSNASAAPSVYKVTGGGQITTPDMKGAGSTVAFTGQSASEAEGAGRGQFQLQLRDGVAKETIHGTVSCVAVFATEEGMPGMAVLGGKSRSGEDFRIDITDDGQGKDTMDMVSVRRGPAARDGAGDGDDDARSDTALCDAEEESAEMMFGRGNVKIHKVREA